MINIIDVSHDYARMTVINALDVKHQKWKEYLDERFGWCNETCGAREFAWDYRNLRFSFASRGDAVQFKLKFGDIQ